MQNKLDINTFELLLKRKPRSIRTQTWFSESYHVFINEPAPKSKEDFYKYVAYAYSWMPTIPSVKEVSPNEWRRISQLLKGSLMEESNLKELLLILIPIINNSIVGTSKVLHFIDPERFPILDARVIRTWNSIFKGDKSMKIKSVLQRLSPEALADNYLHYWCLMHKWKRSCGRKISLRQLENVLFNLDY